MHTPIDVDSTHHDGPKIVWIVLSSTYEGDDIEGVFSARRLALAFVRKWPRAREDECEDGSVLIFRDARGGMLKPGDVSVRRFAVDAQVRP